MSPSWFVVNGTSNTNSRLDVLWANTPGSLNANNYNDFTIAYPVKVSL